MPYPGRAWATELAALRGLLRRERGLGAAFANVGWLWAESVAAMAASFVGGVFVARALPPGDLGVLAYALSLVGILLPLASLGLQDVVIRNLAGGTSRPEETLGTTLALQTAGALVAAALAWGIGSALPSDEITGAVTGVVLLSLLAQPLHGVSLWFAVRVESRYAAWARNGGVVAATILRAALAWAGASVIGFAWAVVAQAVLTGAALVWVARGRAPGILRWRFVRPLASRLLRECWPLLASGLAIALYMKIDLVLLGRLAGLEAAGQYAAAARLSEVWHVLPAAIATSVFPALVRTAEADPRGRVLPARMQPLYDLMVGIGYGVAIPLSLLAAGVAPRVYGDAYAEGGPILAVHIWSFVFVCLGLARSRCLAAEGLVHLALWTSLIGAALGVGLNLFLIPRHGALGAAWATLAAQAGANYLACVLWPALRPAFGQMTRALLLPLRLRGAWRGAIGAARGLGAAAPIATASVARGARAAAEDAR